MFITPYFLRFSIVFSNQMFSNYSCTMDAGFVKLLSDCSYGNGLQGEYQILLSPLLQYYTFQTQFSSMYSDPFRLFLVFSHCSSQLMMSSHDMCMPSQLWRLLLWIHLMKWPFWLQLLQLNTHLQSVLFENLTNVPFCSTFTQTVMKQSVMH